MAERVRPPQSSEEPEAEPRRPAPAPAPPGLSPSQIDRDVEEAMKPDPMFGE